MKENFGFIERADVVKEIFFHFSEYDGDIEELSLGDDVEYGIQVRNVSYGFVKDSYCFVRNSVVLVLLAK